MNKRIAYGLLLAVLGLNLVMGAQVYLYSARASGNGDVYSNIELFTHVLEKVRHQYVEGGDLTYKKLIYGALNGMLDTLDPHSEFLEPQAHTELRNDTEGEFGGIGVVVTKRNGFLTVVSPIDGTPGHRKGIVSGDRIIKINGESTEDFSLEDAVDRLRGKPGTTVNITLYNPETQESRQVKIERAVIEVRTIKDINGDQAFPVGEDGIGYIRITQFGEKTSNELDQALETLQRKGMEYLILDLRGNPGGLLDQAVKVCEKFVPRGQLIVSTKGRDGETLEKRKASYSDPYKAIPIVVLVNGGSASASEIVAGCLQDLNRAIILGEQTFGKGSVQSILPLPDGSALRLTTAKYYTPSERAIHGNGVEPDVVVPMARETERDLYYKRSGGLKSLDKKTRKRVKAVEDAQLQRARDLLTGIRVYSMRHKGGLMKRVASGK